MLSVTRTDLPEDALLRQYRENGAYTDCYTATIPGSASLAEYIYAFYTALPFKMERFVLKWAVSKPSSDAQARQLAESELTAFAAWTVEAREDTQILLSDFRGRTRSWLMVSPESGEARAATRLYFGSAVIPVTNSDTGVTKLGQPYRLLMSFHRLYSRVLLTAARSRLSDSGRIHE